MRSSILIVDDEPAARFGIRRSLEKQGHVIFEAESVAAAKAMVEKESPDVVILDVKLAAERGLDYLPELVSRNNPPVVIVLTAHGSERTAVEAIKKGAYDYLSKPFDIDELRILVRNACEVYRLRQENERLRQEIAGTATFGQLIGSSPAMERVYSLVEKVSPTDVSVLITGESGTGKEMVAREIHQHSRVAGGPFVALNCAAMPEELIESELFGHEKGAFTGATSRREGKFEVASAGSLFLDEIGDMSLKTQAKVLRVLEDKTFHRLGSNELLTTNARIISATNKQLPDEIRQHRFREDLYYRLGVVILTLPPLRERKTDIPALSHAFCHRFSMAYKGTTFRLSKDTLKVFLEYQWPGNVRQLKNCMERAVVLAENEEITLDVISEEIKSKSLTEKGNAFREDYLMVPSSQAFKDAKKDFEKKYIEKCLEKTGGNITQAAAQMGMHRQSLQHKIKELGLNKKYVLSE